jgi:hypothetical protein
VSAAIQTETHAKVQFDVEENKVYDLRTLIVDDNATNRQILRHQLLAWKMQPDRATSGEEALEM